MRAIFPSLRRRDIGALRWRVALERAQHSDDGAGGTVRSFVSFDQVWAAIHPLTATLADDDGRVAQASTHRIIMRWRADLDTGCRIRLGARIFTINAVTDADDLRRYLAIQVQETQP